MATSAEPPFVDRRPDAAEARPSVPSQQLGYEPLSVLAGEMEVLGRIAHASNLALLVRLVPAAGSSERDRVDGSAEPEGQYAIYKPVRGERPLWDFPHGTLAGREVAAHEVSRLGGWDLIPPTVLRKGPLGPGMVQQWIGDPFEDFDRDDSVVDLVPFGQLQRGWHAVFDGETAEGSPVTLVHSDEDDVRSLAALDAVINNSDRKGSHCLRDDDGRLWAIDHGVTFSPDPKLRTVLWGWAGEPLREVDLSRLERLRRALTGHDNTEPEPVSLERLLPPADVAALTRRVERLLRDGRHPQPSGDWPAVPWPPL